MRDVFFPESLEALWPFLEESSRALLAGGTDLLVKVRAGRADPSAFICLERIAELRGVRERETDLWIGACTSHAELIGHPLVERHLPVLHQALRGLGSPLIRRMGTLGGNLCTASPAGDTLPPLYVLDAVLELRSRSGKRAVPIGEFITGPGRTRLEPGEILAGVRVEKPAGRQVHHFEKVGQRKAMAIGVASMAALLRFSADGAIEAARFAWGSVGPTVMTCQPAEALLAGERPSREVFERAAALARAAVAPIDDIRASAEYRRTVSGNLLLRLLSLHSVLP
ncbi:Molybdopterin dehydrogenase FAD-binding [uncultured Desulfatiglans sp.]|uniref:Molybdopterin dehydrogenase FAD-binding n=1 Tax=Uncultured Desulfatiglans sp. TaxID=1748965 RepID=A0A653AEW5_UNCDX|nr:Molybdopterin dehydrogenase FAD-binding [uncultured Desulfatiglans sp.]